MVLKNCPICESPKIKIVTGPLEIQTPTAKVFIPKVKREICQNCGEEFFDHEANVVLDQYRGRARRTSEGRSKRSRPHGQAQRARS